MNKYILTIVFLLFIITPVSAINSTYSDGTITVNSGINTLNDVYNDIGNLSYLSKSDNIYILNAHLTIAGGTGATLNIEGETLKFNGAYRLLNKGTLNVNGSVITSVEQTSSTTNRGYIWCAQKRYDAGFNLNVSNSELSYLGQPGSTDDPETNSGGVGRRGLWIGGSSGGGWLFGAATPPIVNNNYIHHLYNGIWANGGGDIVTNNIFRYIEYDVADITEAAIFDNNEISYNTLNAGYIVISWGGDTQITNNNFSNNYGTNAMLWIKNGVGGTIIRNNTFKNNSGSANRINVVGTVHTVWSYIENNTIDDSTSTSTVGINIVGDGWGGSYDVLAYIRNNTIIGGNIGIRYECCGYAGDSSAAKHLRVSDNTITGARYGIWIDNGGHDDSVAFNNTISGSIYDDFIVGYTRATNSITPKNINTKYDTSKITVTNGYFYDYKLLDIYVIDNVGNPVNGATVTIANTIDNSHPSININGSNQNVFTTGSDGHTPLPSNEFNSIAILDFYKTSSTQVEMSYSISVYYTGFSNSTTISPTTGYYRSNPEAYQNTTTLTLDTTVSQTVNTPTFNPDEGTYYNYRLVTIETQTSGASIYYTIDGSEPDSGDTLYSSPVNITSNITLKAIGIRTNFTNSSVKSANYTILPATVPTVPQNFQVSWINSLNRLTWSAPSSNGGLNITAYNIYRGINTSITTLLTTVSSSTYSYDDVVIGDGVTVFYYNISATNPQGNSVNASENITPPIAQESLISQGSNSIKDNRMKETAPNTVYQGDAYLDIGHLVGVSRYRDLIWANLTSLNTNDSVTSSNLYLWWYYPVGARAQNTVVEIYRPACNWDYSGVTWNNCTSLLQWDQSGGVWYDANDVLYGSSPYATYTFNSSIVPTQGYIAFDVTSLVQRYVTGQYQNVGFYLKDSVENDNYIAFRSTEESTSDDAQPKLATYYNIGTGTPYSESGVGVTGYVYTTNIIPASDITVYIDESGLPTNYTTTDSNGRYWFNDTGIGDYGIYAIWPNESSNGTFATTTNSSYAWANLTLIDSYSMTVDETKTIDLSYSSDYNSDTLTYSSNDSNVFLSTNGIGYFTPNTTGTYVIKFGTSDGMWATNRTILFTVTSKYNISGYINDTLGAAINAVSIVNGTNSTTTNATGYYNISSMTNGTWNFTYSKTGYVTNYKEIIINGADVVNQNVTLTISSSSITIPANSWGMFNNWSVNTNFSSIATNESNDVTYTFYNVTSGEWDLYYPGYSWNADQTIDKNNSMMGLFSAQTTITANTVTPWNTSISEGWNMLYLMGITNRTLTEICTNMVNCTDIYYYNSTTNDYVSTGTDTIQPNQGFLAYVNQTGTWIRSTI